MRGPQDVALVVLQHGMWGMPADMAYVEATIKARTNPRRVVVLNAGEGPAFEVPQPTTERWCAGSDVARC